VVDHDASQCESAKNEGERGNTEEHGPRYPLTSYEEGNDQAGKPQQQDKDPESGHGS
jgi:hypothetical protein